MDEYNKGFPKRRGLYRCKVNGEEKYLVHHACDLNGKHWWTDTRGYDVVGYEVLWSGTSLAADDLK